MAKGKLIAKWTDTMQVGIWDNTRWTVRLYEDRAVVHYPTVKWVNNSGSLSEITERWEPTETDKGYFERLIKIAAHQADDDADYTEKVRRLVWQAMQGDY